MWHNMTKEYDTMKYKYFRVQANVNLDAICGNIVQIRNVIKPNTKIMAVIKADGYGHGALSIAKVLDKIGVDAYAIAILEEGIALRQEGITKPLLILGYTPNEQYDALVAYDISQTVFEYSMAYHISKEAKKQKKQGKIHIKLDTGMNRIGFSDTEESIEEIIRISQLPNIEIEGIFTHFACADELDKTKANRQIKRFSDFVTKLEARGIVFPMKHISNSAGIIDLPEANYDMVRSGIITYGLYPSEEVNKKRLQLTPALELKSHVVSVKEIGAGEEISYGGTYTTTKTTKVATVSVGYGDGYPRTLSSKGRVLINGQYASILGRICMDQFMVDVTDIPNVKQGDVVTLVGKDQKHCITVEEVAANANSFNYEFICNIGKRIPRVYYKDGEIIDCSDFYQY